MARGAGWLAGLGLAGLLGDPIAAAEHRFEASVWAGWAGAGLGGLHDHYRELANRESGGPHGAAGSGTGSVVEEWAGYGAGAEAGWWIRPALLLAVRAGVSAPGAVGFEVNTFDSAGWFSGYSKAGRVNAEMQMMIVPLLAGVAFEPEWDGDVGVRLAAWCGAALVRASERHYRHTTETGDFDGDFVTDQPRVIQQDWTGRYAGLGSAGELSIGLVIPLASWLALGLEGAYRFVWPVQLRLVDAVDESGTGAVSRPVGDPYRDVRGRPLRLNLSGGEVRLALRTEL